MHQNAGVRAAAFALLVVAALVVRDRDAKVEDVKLEGAHLRAMHASESARSRRLQEVAAAARAEHAVGGPRTSGSEASVEGGCTRCHYYHSNPIILSGQPLSGHLGASPDASRASSPKACTLGRIATRLEAMDVLPRIDPARGEFCMSPTSAFDPGTALVAFELGDLYRAGEEMNPATELPTCITCHEARGNEVLAGFGHLGSIRLRKDEGRGARSGATDDDQSTCR